MTMPPILIAIRFRLFIILRFHRSDHKCSFWQLFILRFYTLLPLISGASSFQFSSVTTIGFLSNKVLMLAFEVPLQCASDKLFEYLLGLTKSI